MIHLFTLWHNPCSYGSRTVGGCRYFLEDGHAAPLSQWDAAQYEPLTFVRVNKE